MKRVLLVLVAFLFVSCTETTQLVMPTGNSGFGTGNGYATPAPPSLVNEVLLAPSFLKIRNGDEVRVQVTTFAAGGVEVLASFSPAIEGEQVVQILPATPSSQANREIILKGKGVGECTLVVRSGDARGSAPIKVTSAN